MASIFANMSVSMDLIIFVVSIEFFGNGNGKFSVANKFDSYINVIVYLLLYETIFTNQSYYRSNEQKINIKLYFLIVAKLFCLLGINNLLKNKRSCSKGIFSCTTNNQRDTNNRILTDE